MTSEKLYILDFEFTGLHPLNSFNSFKYFIDSSCVYIILKKVTVSHDHEYWMLIDVGEDVKFEDTHLNQTRFSYWKAQGATHFTIHWTLHRKYEGRQTVVDAICKTYYSRPYPISFRKG